MKTVKIVNPKQMAKYMKYGVKPLDMFYDANTDRVVYIFDQEKTEPLFEKWRKFELE